MIWIGFMRTKKTQRISKKDLLFTEKMRAVVMNQEVSHFLQDFEKLLYFMSIANQADCVRTCFHLYALEHFRQVYSKLREELQGFLEVYQNEQYQGDKQNLRRAVNTRCDNLQLNFHRLFSACFEM